VQIKCKNRPQAVELAYNIVNALKKYGNNCDFKLFYLILNGDLPEDSWQEQQSMLLSIKVCSVPYKTGKTYFYISLVITAGASGPRAERTWPSQRRYSEDITRKSVESY
jgi:hypothetical protein